MHLLSEKEYYLLSAVRKNPDISVEKLAKLFSMPNDFVVYHMENIEEKDYVRIAYLTNEQGSDIIGVLYNITPKGEEALENYADIKKRNFWKSLESKLWKLVPILISLLSLYIAYAD